MDSVEYARLLKNRLPEGPAWPHETDEGTAFDDLLRALGTEPARFEADSLQILDEIIPDNTNTDLVAWERLVGSPTEQLTDAERLARIRGILRASGAVDQASLQAAFRALSGDETLILYNRARPSFAVGLSNVGDAVGDFGALWLVELYDNVLSLGPESSWTTRSGSLTLFADDAVSPVTLNSTADRYVMAAAAEIENELASGLADDALIYATVWAMTATNETVELSLLDKAGALQTTSFDLEGGVWNKLEITKSLGVGSGTPSLVLSSASSMIVWLSWALAGVKNTALEAGMSAMTQLHTRGVFGIKTEYTTLRAQDNLEVVF